MSKRRFTKEQIEGLMDNPNVVRCSKKAITYAKQFKVTAVKQSNEDGLSGVNIFKQAGFNLEVVGKDTADYCLKAWRKIYRKYGEQGLLKDRRGTKKGNSKGRMKMKGLTDAQKIERLETTIAYLKAENDFLAKLRAKRVE